MTKTLDPGIPEDDATDPALIRQVDSGAADLAGVDRAAFAALERISRSLHSRTGDLQSTIDCVASAARQVVTGTRDAGVNLMVRDSFLPQPANRAAPHPLDVLQQRAGNGPAVAAARDLTLVHLRDVRVDAPWPAFGALAERLGICSALCVPLWAEDSRVGSLSLYAAEPHLFGDQELRVASLLGTQAALVITDAVRVENLRRGLDNRDVIGQAKGILMERHRITADQAFGRLVTASQQSNRKLAQVAEELTRTGVLPH